MTYFAKSRSIRKLPTIKIELSVYLSAACKILGDVFEIKLEVSLISESGSQFRIMVIPGQVSRGA